MEFLHDRAPCRSPEQWQINPGRSFRAVVPDVQSSEGSPVDTWQARSLQGVRQARDRLRFPEERAEGHQRPEAEHADRLQGPEGSRPSGWRRQVVFDRGTAGQSALI